MLEPRLGFDSYTSEGDFYRDDSPEQQRIDEQRDFAFGGGLLKGITELPLDIMEFLSPEDEYNPGVLAPDQSSPRQRIRTERLHGEQFYDELKSDPITKQAAEVGYGASMVVDPVLDTGILMAPHLLKGLNAIRKGEKPAIKLADLMTDEVGAIRAFHGTPHEVDKFKMANVGTGEGNQAYGHGMYFAESPEVARSYSAAKALDTGDIFVKGERVNPDSKIKGIALNAVRGEAHYTSGGNPIDNAIKYFKDNAGASTIPSKNIEDSEALTYLLDIKKQGAEFKPAGSTYEVDLDVNPEDLLDWDAQLSEQPAKIKTALKDIGYGDDSLEMTGAEIHEDLQWFHGNDKEKAASELKEAGIGGIRYYNQGARTIGGKGAAEHNVVIFDESLINILGKE